MAGRIKSLVSDTMIYGVFTIVGRFITFMLTPLYTNYLTMSELGEQSNLFAILAFINIVYSVGMDSAFFRFYDKNDLSFSKKVFTSSYLVILFISLILTIFFIIKSSYLSPFFISGSNGKYIIIISSMIPLLDSMIFVPFALLRLTRRAKKFSTTRFIMIIIAVVLNYVFLVNFHLGILGICIAQLIASITGVVMVLPEVVSNMTFKFNLKLLNQMFRFGLPTLPATFSGTILQVADKPIMNYLGGSVQAGMYNANYKLGIPMMLLVSVFEYAWKPFYLSHFNDKDAKIMFRRIFTYFTLICALFFLITGFFIEFIVRMPFVGGKFIKPDYWSGMGIIPIILGGYYLNGVFNNFAAGFQINKKTEYLPLAIGIAAIANVIINFLTIPYFGIWGAAWATFFAYLISAFILYYFTRKVYPIFYDWSKVSFIILTTLIIYFGGSFLSSKFGLLTNFIIKFVSVLIFIIIIIYFGIISKTEMNQIKKIFKRD